MNRHPDPDPTEESRATAERRFRPDNDDGGRRDHPDERREPGSPDDGHPEGSLPPFTDPAFSSKPATPAVLPDAPDYPPPPKDTEFAGHPEFSEDAANNEPPDGMGLTEAMDDGEGGAGTSEGVNMPVPDADRDRR